MLQPKIHSFNKSIGKIKTKKVNIKSLLLGMEFEEKRDIAYRIPYAA